MSAKIEPPLGPRLTLQIESPIKAGRAQLMVSDRTVIGRASDSTASDLDLDLTPYGAAENGVSRQHAALSHQGSIIYVEDLDSTSGTRINGLELTPHQKYRLRDGDELELGRVRLTVRLAR